MSEPHSSALRWRPVWFGIGCLLVLAVCVGSLMPGGEGEPLIPDKVMHAIAYAVLMFWFALLYPRAAWRRIAAVLIVLGVALEYGQHLGGHRSYEVADMAANAVGIALGAMLALTPLKGLLVWIEARFA